MANLSALNKINKLQQFLNNRNIIIGHLACRTIAATCPRTSSPPILIKQNTQNTAAHAAWHHHSTSTVIRSYSTKDTAAASIDEFRAREEKREEEYEKQDKNSTQQQCNDEEDAKKAKLEAIRTQILEAALPHVPTLGWTRNAIVQGAEEVGLPSVVHGMFPEGGFELVSYFNGKCNQELFHRMQLETNNGEKILENPLDFLLRFIQMRLEMIVPYKAQWPQALALIAMPQNAKTALAQVLTLVDDICYYSGDRSVDIGWYTRRIGLATIMKMTELYMIQDSSTQHTKTWEFLKNRMEEAMLIQTALQQTEGVTHKFQTSFNSAFITARNILGLGYNRP